MKKKSIFPLLLAIALIKILVPLTCTAQDSSLKPDATIRITTKFYRTIRQGELDNKFIGQFVCFRGDTLLFRDNFGLRLIPVAQIKRLEIRYGEKSNTFKGIAAGALIGGISLGTYVGADACKDIDASNGAGELHRTSTFFVFFSAVFPIGAVVGGLIGAAFGKSAKTDLWREIEITPELIADTSAANDSTNQNKKIP